VIKKLIRKNQMAEEGPLSMDVETPGEEEPGETQEECNRRICTLVVPFVFDYHSRLRNTLVNRMRDVDPWHGFIPAHTLGRSQTFMVQHTARFALKDAPNEPYVITPAAVQCTVSKSALPKNPATHPETGAICVYSPDEVYPFAMSVRRWSNDTPMALGVHAIGTPLALQVPEVSQILRNWGLDGQPAFMIIKPGETHDTAQQKPGQVPFGNAYVSRDFGVVSESYLMAFGALREQHLKNGCVQLPDALMQQAGLPFTLVEGEGNVRSWYMVPTDSLIAWPINELDYAERVQQMGVIAIGPLHAHDKRTDRLIAPYWLMTDQSLDMLCREAATHLINRVRPEKLMALGVKVMPSECPGTPSWTDLSINKEVTPLTPPDEVARIMAVERSFGVKIYLKYAIFPVGLSTAPNLAPKLPPDWPKFSAFRASSDPLIGGVQTSDQRAK
jgi:hypothetical protein